MLLSRFSTIYITSIVLYNIGFNHIKNAALPKQILILEEHQCEQGYLVHQHWCME